MSTDGTSDNPLHLPYSQAITAECWYPRCLRNSASTKATTAASIVVIQWQEPFVSLEKRCPEARCLDNAPGGMSVAVWTALGDFRLATQRVSKADRRHRRHCYSGELS